MNQITQSRFFPLFLAATLAGSLVLTGCASSKSQILASEESQIKLRSIQTRAFDTTDKTLMLRTVMATLQDLGFVVDSADETLGTVTGTKLDGYALRMTVTVRTRGTTQLMVRASGQYNLAAVEDAEPYQQFFASLSKSIFLTAQQVD